MNEVKKSRITPRMDDFNPAVVPWQIKLLQDYHNPNIFDFTKGVQTIVLSGAVGSAKSLFCSHLTWLHLTENKDALVCLTRLDRRRLKDTSYKLFLDHRPKCFKLGSDVNFSKVRSVIDFNKSELKAVHWAGMQDGEPITNTVLGMYYSDGDYVRFRSLEFSFVHMEEAVEAADSEIYKVLKERTRRPSCPKKTILLSTNPSEPDHWVNQELIQKAGWVNGVRQQGEGLDDCIHVYYSLTTENPTLDPSYVEGLLRSLSELEAQRMIYGKWVSLYGKNLYYAYGEHNKIRQHYKINLAYPIRVTFDFNCAKGKPMSCVLGQYIAGKFHLFKQYAIEGDTSSLMNELLADGVFDHNVEYIIHGDAAGWSKSTASFTFCDYDIIKKALENYTQKKINFKIVVGKSNPDVKVRHNTMNTFFKNGMGEPSIFLYEGCFQGKVNLDQSFRLTRLKDSAKYIEDDGPAHPYQHMGTAVGYMVCEVIKKPAGISVITPR